MALVSIALGWIVAGRVLQPLHRITATARRLSDQNLHERIALEGPSDELKELADTFDDMLVRLSTAFDAQKRFIANASHELRTPLAIQRALVDVELAGPGRSPEDSATAEKLRHAIGRSERLIDSLLLLARSVRRIEEWSPVDLAAGPSRRWTPRRARWRRPSFASSASSDRPPPAATPRCSSGWSATSSRTRSATTSTAVRSRSPRERPTVAPPSRWRTPGPTSAPARSPGSRAVPTPRGRPDPVGRRLRAGPVDRAGGRAVPRRAGVGGPAARGWPAGRGAAPHPAHRGLRHNAWITLRRAERRNRLPPGYRRCRTTLLAGERRRRTDEQESGMTKRYLAVASLALALLTAPAAAGTRRPRAWPRPTDPGPPPRPRGRRRARPTRSRPRWPTSSACGRTAWTCRTRTPTG